MSEYSKIRMAMSTLDRMMINEGWMMKPTAKKDPQHVPCVIQRFAIRWALGCEKFVPGPARLLLSKQSTF